MDIPAVNLQDLHTAIAEDLATAVPAFKTIKADYAFIDFETWHGQDFPLLTLECNRMNPVAEQGGGEQLRVQLDFEFRVVLIDEGSAQLKARGLALKVAQAIHLNQFDQPIKHFKIDDITTDFMMDDKNRKYAVMLIEAHTEALAGINIWEDPPTVEFEHISAYVTVNGDNPSTEVIL
ncbi:MAG: hypothetical protein HEQ32_01895 [Vampirovibrio sp.]